MPSDPDTKLMILLQHVRHKGSSQSRKGSFGCEQISGCNRPCQDGAEDGSEQLPCVYIITCCPYLIGVETDSAASSNVFLGRALEKLDQNEDSEEAYKTAIGIKDKDALAWQGLVGLYEKQAGKKLDDYHDAAIRLAEIHMNEYVGNDFRTLGHSILWLIDLRFQE